MFAVCKAFISLRTAMLFGRFLSQIRQISRSGILEVRWSCTTSPFFNGFFCQCLRIKSDSEVVSDHRQDLICGSGFDIRIERQIMLQKVIDMHFSCSSILSERNKRNVRKF